MPLLPTSAPSTIPCPTVSLSQLLLPRVPRLTHNLAKPTEASPTFPEPSSGRNDDEPHRLLLRRRPPRGQAPTVPIFAEKHRGGNPLPLLKFTRLSFSPLVRRSITTATTRRRLHR